MVTPIQSSETEGIFPYIRSLYIPRRESHKGQNGKVMIIGGSHLFHAASIWAAESCSYFTDMVHYASVEENNEVVRTLKGLFRSGIIVSQQDIPSYIDEDNAILIGPGMVRGEKHEVTASTWYEVMAIPDEADRTRAMVHFLLRTYPEKRFVIDAGALQMADPDWFRNMKTKPIITPHQIEFERVFGISVEGMSPEQKQEAVRNVAKEYGVIVLLKAIYDIISDGERIIVVEGGNAGLTKGGTGDVLAGLITSLFAKNDAITSCVLGSYLEKRAADTLYKTKGHWYNVTNLIDKIPETLTELVQ